MPERDGQAPARLTAFVAGLTGPPARRKASTSPTQRTLQRLRREGYTAAVVERYNPHAQIRQDLFGFLDVVAIRPDVPGVLGIQATTASNLASRRTKLDTVHAMRVWLAAGNALELWGWAKRGPRGARKLWTLTRERITQTGDV